MLRSRLTAVLLLLPLAGCAAVPSSACPPLKNYTPAQQTAAATELDALPAGSVLAGMVSDYGVLRDQVRACHTGST